MINRVKMFWVIMNMFLIMRATSFKVAIIWLLFSLCSLFLVVKTVSYCKGHENMWLFVLTAIGTIPVNIKATNLILYSGIFDSGIPIIGPILASIEIYLLLFAMEEILIGIIGRLLFRKQYTFGEN